MTEIIGGTVILSCPAHRLYGSAINRVIGTTWSKGYITPQLLARVSTLKSEMTSNKPHVEGVWIDNIGNLNIRNSKMKDAGLYTCRVTGYPETEVELIMKGMYTVF